eukprot:6216272-Prymnesium_polylepis.1
MSSSATHARSGAVGVVGRYDRVTPGTRATRTRWRRLNESAPADPLRTLIGHERFASACSA